MPTLDELIQQALELDVFLRDCPQSCRNAAALVEQAHFSSPHQDRFSDTMAIFNWLSLARGMQRTMLHDTQILQSTKSNDREGSQNPVIKHYMEGMAKYISPTKEKTKAEKHEVIHQFVKNHPKLFDGGVINTIELTTIPLDELINEQLDQLLYLSVSSYISGTLEGLVTQKNPTFSAEKVLAEALLTYKLKLIDDIVQQFNLIRLIELQAQNIHSDKVVKEIEQLIKEAQDKQLSLSTIQQLHGKLRDLIWLDNEITEPDKPLVVSMKEAIANHITNCEPSEERHLSSELGFQATTSLNKNITKTSLTKDFFESDRHTKLEFCLSNVFQCVMMQRRSIIEKLKRQGLLTDRPLQSAGTDEIKPLKFNNPNTQDSALQALGKAVEEYDQMLSDHQTEEAKSYPNRDDQHVKNRQKAVRTLLRSVNRADELTAPLKYLGFMLIQEIKANKPTWKERSLIIKIVDILFLGIPALLRNTFFKRTLEAEKALLKTTESFPHDMKQVEAMRKQQSSPPIVRDKDTDSVDSSGPPSPNT